MKKQPSKDAHERARALRWELTQAEKLIWYRLRLRQTHGFRFRRQVPIGAFIADFLRYEGRLVVEIDGGQHDPLSELEERRTRFLENEGYRVLRFWNNDVMDNLDGAQMVIAQHLRRAHPHPNPPPSRGRAFRSAAG